MCSNGMIGTNALKAVRGLELPHVKVARHHPGLDAPLMRAYDLGRVHDSKDVGASLATEGPAASDQIGDARQSELWPSWDSKDRGPQG